jgi:coenzyme F420 hydrogenase subunit beta
MEWKLNEVIVETNQCAKCSTCAIVCPNNLVKFDNKPYIEEECLRKGNGMCFEVCPRVSSGKYQIKLRENFKELYYYARSDVEGQDGGVVTAFLKYLLESGRIDGAIVVGDECWKPVSMIVQNAEDLLKTSKSKYTVSTLDALRKAGEMGLEKVAVVGLPCQINGLRKLQYFPYHAKHDFELGKDGKPVKLPKIEYLIGLFCMEKFEYNSLKEVLSKYGIDIKDVEKFDIKKGKLLVYVNGEKKEIDLKEIEICPGCKMCRDFDAELADVSVGSVGSPDGYSTIIIRTEKGEEIKNAVELKEGVDIEVIDKLRKKKLKRFKEEVERRRKNNEPVSFYWTADYGGIGKRADGTYFIRIRAKPAGFYDADDIEFIAKLAKEYNIKLKLNCRQGIELQGVSGFDVEDIVLKLIERGLLPGSTGAGVVTILACPGKGNCSLGVGDSEGLAKMIEERFRERPTPNKFKMAISGCPNGCVRHQIHEIGVVGVRYPKVSENCNGCGRCAEVCKVEAIDIRGEISYTNYNVCVGCGKCIKECPNDARDVKEEGFLVYVGGKTGREVVEGIKVGIMSAEEVVEFIDKVLTVYEKYALKPLRERLPHVMARVGHCRFIEEVKSLMNKNA